MPLLTFPSFFLAENLKESEAFISEQYVGKICLELRKLPFLLGGDIFETGEIIRSVFSAGRKMRLWKVTKSTNGFERVFLQRKEVGR